MPDVHLTARERTLLERWIDDLRADLGTSLHAVWLFGSRARGEDTGEDSDVDILVVADRADWDERMRIRGMVDTAASELGALDEAAAFSVHVHTPDWVEGRREIRSFFMAEIDRDKQVLVGTS